MTSASVIYILPGLGYWGIGARSSEIGFNFTAYVFREGAGVSSISPRLTATATGISLSSASISLADCPVSTWCFVTVSLLPVSNVQDTLQFELVVDQGEGTLLLDHVSLFSNDAVAGLFRPDLLELIKGLAPGFMRMPGGNYLEGYTFDTRWEWKNALSHRQNRSGHYNSAWGYWVGCASSLLKTRSDNGDLGDRRGWIVRAVGAGRDHRHSSAIVYLHRLVCLGGGDAPVND